MWIASQSITALGLGPRVGLLTVCSKKIIRKINDAMTMVIASLNKKISDVFFAMTSSNFYAKIRKLKESFLL